MTDDLRLLLRDRAERAAEHAEPSVVAATVAALADRRRRNRARAAIASTVAVVVAITCVGLAVGDDHGPERTAPAPLGTGPITDHHADRAGQHRSGRQRTDRERRRRAAVAAQRQQYERYRAARLELRLERASSHLVPISPAPAGNEVSISLVPRCFVYLGRQSSAVSLYGFPGTDQEGAFAHGLVLDVHLTMPATKFPETIAGRPASFDTSKDGSVLALRYDRSHDVGFRTGFPMTRRDAARIAATIEVRSTKQSTKG